MGKVGNYGFIDYLEPSVPDIYLYWIRLTFGAYSFDISTFPITLTQPNSTYNRPNPQNWDKSVGTFLRLPWATYALYLPLLHSSWLERLRALAWIPSQAPRPNQTVLIILKWHAWYMSSIILTQIHRIFVNFFLFRHRVSFIFFYLIKNITIRCENAHKERQTFRPHMGALFSAINSKINSKFL